MFSDLGSESLRGLSPPIWYSPGGAWRFHAPSALSPSLSPPFPLPFPPTEPSDLLQCPPLFSMSTTVPAARTGDFYSEVGSGLGSLPAPLRTYHTRPGKRSQRESCFFPRLVPFFSRQMGGRTSPYCEKGESRTSCRLNLRLPVEDK